MGTDTVEVDFVSTVCAASIFILLDTVYTLKMEAACFSGTLPIYQATLCNMSEGYNFHMHQCENHKFHMVVIYATIDLHDESVGTWRNIKFVAGYPC